MVLTRMTGSQMTSSLSPPSPQNHWSEDESLGTDGSDMQWEPNGDSSDTDFSFSSTHSNKRKKMTKKNGKPNKNGTTHQEKRNSIANRSRAKTSTPTTNAENSAKSSQVKTLTQQAGTVTDAKGKTAKSPQADTNTSAESKATKTSTKPASASGNDHKIYIMQKHKKLHVRPFFFFLHQILGLCGDLCVFKLI